MEIQYLERFCRKSVILSMHFYFYGLRSVLFKKALDYVFLKFNSILYCEWCIFETHRNYMLRQLDHSRFHYYMSLTIYRSIYESISWIP